jgi:CubicO group peptidase (beta-lactamase class C family)
LSALSVNLARAWERQGLRIIAQALAAGGLLFPVACSSGSGTGEDDFTVGPARGFQAAMAAHHLCSGVFVVGRDFERTPEQVLREDIERFPVFQWQADFDYEVDHEAKTARVWGPGVSERVARYHWDQGCTILPEGEAEVFFEPSAAASSLPEASTQAWPTGDNGAHHDPLPPDVDAEALEAALEWAMARAAQNTRALVVTYQGKILGERYAPGFTKNTPQISWSQGKSITAALIGVLVQQGAFEVEDPAPVVEWQSPDDPRRQIQILHLLRMSSGLDFENWGLDGEDSWTEANEHFRIYFDAIDVFEHAIDQPLEIPPDSEFRYRNSDPLTLGRIVRETVEARGESYLTFPRRALFDRIGARDYVLETDAWGNFIMTGYDYGSAYDWTRFGLLHLWDGVWEGERILPEGWVDLIKTPAPGDPNEGYGGLFWLNRGGRYDRVPKDAFWAAGFMGQTTMVIPSSEMVIVRLGPSPSGFDPYFNEVAGRVLEAVGAGSG